MDKLLVRYDSDRVKEIAHLRKAREGDCGYDLYNASDVPIRIKPGTSVQISAGAKIKIPDGYCGLIRSRSSTFKRRGVFVITGVIDSGYTGPLYTLAWNPALNGMKHDVIVEPWERISQLVIIPAPSLTINVVDELPQTMRGEDGFGSTGL